MLLTTDTPLVLLVKTSKRKKKRHSTWQIPMLVYSGPFTDKHDTIQRLYIANVNFEIVALFERDETPTIYSNSLHIICTNAYFWNSKKSNVIKTFLKRFDKMLP